MGVQRRRFSDEFKIEAVKLVTEQGLSIAEASRDVGVSSVALGRWKRKFEHSLQSKTVEQDQAYEFNNLHKENSGFRMEYEDTIEIIRNLANGIFPATGEPMPKDSPYEDTATIRALYKAIEALESYALSKPLVPRAKQERRQSEKPILWMDIGSNDPWPDKPDVKPPLVSGAEHRDIPSSEAHQRQDAIRKREEMKRLDNSLKDSPSNSDGQPSDDFELDKLSTYDIPGAESFLSSMNSIDSRLGFGLEEANQMSIPKKLDRLSSKEHILAKALLDDGLLSEDQLNNFMNLRQEYEREGKKYLGEILISKRLITEDILDIFLDVANQSYTKFCTVLVNQGMMTQDQYQQLMEDSESSIDIVATLETHNILDSAMFMKLYDQIEGTPRFGEWLVSNNYLQRDEMEKALTEQRLHSFEDYLEYHSILGKLSLENYNSKLDLKFSI